MTLRVVLIDFDVYKVTQLHLHWLFWLGRS